MLNPDPGSPSRNRAGTDISRHTARQAENDGRPCWWEISATILSSIGFVLTPAWLYLPDRDWSSTTAYLDPWYHAVITLAMLGLGWAMSFVAVDRRFTPLTPNKWVTASQRLSVIGVSAVVICVLVIPLAILLIRVATAIVTAWLLLNSRRIMRGQLPNVPRSLTSWMRVTEKAIEIGPHRP